MVNKGYTLLLTPVQPESSNVECSTHCYFPTIFCVRSISESFYIDDKLRLDCGSVLGLPCESTLRNGGFCMWLNFG